MCILFGGSLFLLVLGMECVILLWRSLGLTYFENRNPLFRCYKGLKHTCSAHILLGAVPSAFVAMTTTITNKLQSGIGVYAFFLRILMKIFKDTIFSLYMYDKTTRPSPHKGNGSLWSV